MLKITDITVKVNSTDSQADLAALVNLAEKIKKAVYSEASFNCKLDFYVNSKIEPALAEINIKGVKNGN